MDLHPNSTTIISAACGVHHHKLYRWYKDFLSGFKQALASGLLHCHDVLIKKGRAEEKIVIPILERINFGKHMSIDEKQIGEEMCTILSNRESGKIALLAQTVNYEELKEILSEEDYLCRDVQTITRDLSPTYKKLCDTWFFNAAQIADKFHIVKNLIDAMQNVRIRFRQEHLRTKRLAYEGHKFSEKQRRGKYVSNWQPFKYQPFSHKEELLYNGESTLEVLAKGRYLLYKYSCDLTEKQAIRAKSLFERFPQIQKSHELSCLFRTWYSKFNIGKSKLKIVSDLLAWFNLVKDADIDELLNFSRSVQRNQLAITNYFTKGDTNVKAENINRRIN